MESKERRIECPECKELMPALLLNDLNKCDNCGCPAHLFDRDLTFFGESEICGNVVHIRRLCWGKR